MSEPSSIFVPVNRIRSMPLWLQVTSVAEKHQSILEEYTLCRVDVERAKAAIDSAHSKSVADLVSRTKDRRKADYRAKVKRLEAKRATQIDKASRPLERLSDSRAYTAYREEMHLRRPEIAIRNRQAMRSTIFASKHGPKRTIVVTHERLTKVEVDFPDIPLFLFGHRHGFRNTLSAGSRFVNVSVLDNPVTVLPNGVADNQRSDACRNINDGNYAVIEGSNLHDLKVSCVKFSPYFDGWGRQPIVIIGPAWVDSSLLIVWGVSVSSATRRERAAPPRSQRSPHPGSVTGLTEASLRRKLAYRHQQTASPKRRRTRAKSAGRRIVRSGDRRSSEPPASPIAPEKL
jgi:hypothetical protein